MCNLDAYECFQYSWKVKKIIFLIPSQIGLFKFVSNHLMIIIVFEQETLMLKDFWNHVFNLLLLIEIDYVVCSGVEIDLKIFKVGNT